MTWDSPVDVFPETFPKRSEKYQTRGAKVNRALLGDSPAEEPDHQRSRRIAEPSRRVSPRRQERARSLWDPPETRPAPLPTI